MLRVNSVTLATGAVVLSGLVGGVFGGRLLATQEQGIPKHYEAFA